MSFLIEPLPSFYGMTASDIIGAFFITWIIGLTPPILIRYVFLKRSLERWISISICLVFWFINLMLFLFLGSRSKTHGALYLIAAASYYILRKSVSEEADVSSAKAVDQIDQIREVNRRNSTASGENSKSDPPRRNSQTSPEVEEMDEEELRSYDMNLLQTAHISGKAKDIVKRLQRSSNCRGIIDFPLSDQDRQELFLLLSDTAQKPKPGSTAVTTIADPIKDGTGEGLPPRPEGFPSDSVLFERGLSLEEGLDGPRDYQGAAALFTSAANKGHALAQFHLGRLLLEGRGMPQDFEMAYFWLNVAAAHLDGDDIEPAIQERDRAAGLLSPTELLKIQRACRDWKGAVRGGDQ